MATDVRVEAPTETVDNPDREKSCVDVAVMVAVPAAVGVNTPVLLIAPMVAGLTAHVTSEEKLPVPVNAGEHVEV